MKTKRILALLLAVVMVLSVASMIVFAEGENGDTYNSDDAALAANANYTCKIGTKYYITLDAALTAAVADNTTQDAVTITAIKDLTYSNMTSVTRNIIIDGADNTLTSTADAVTNKAFLVTLTGGCTVTIQNFSQITVYGGFELKAKDAIVNMNNCKNVNSTNNPLFRIHCDGCKVNVNGSEINHTGAYYVFAVANTNSLDNYLEATSDTTAITIENSTIDFKGTKTGADCALFWYASAKSTNTLALKGNTTITYAPTKKTAIRFIYYGNKGPLTFTADNTVTINYNPTAAGTTTHYFVNRGSETAGAADLSGFNGTLKLGTTFGEDVVAVKVGDTLYNPNDIDKSIGTSTFSLVKMGVTNLVGASIKLPADANETASIRFVANVDSTFKTTLGANATYGHVVTTDANFAEGTVKTSSANNAFVWYDDTTYGVALNKISDYTKTYKVTAYVTITYADSSTATFYADYTDENNARSVVDVATKALADTEAGYSQDVKDALDAIVNPVA